MSEVFERVVALMEEDGWPVLLVPRQLVALTRASGRSGRWDCQMYLREEANQLDFYSVCPFVIPEDQRGALAEFLTRANHGIPNGNFEMDFDQGVVRYKTNLGLVKLDLAVEHIHALCLPNTWLMDAYLPGIQAVAEGRLDAKAAIDLVENPQPEADESEPVSEPPEAGA